MLEELKAKLHAEAEKLRYELNVTLPGEIARAVELGDLKENSEYKAALERQRFVQARLGQLGERLSKLANVDLSLIPADKAGLGSTVTVEDLATGAQETYELVIGDSDEFDDDAKVTMSSPIGRALVDKAVGEETILKLPTKVRRLKIVTLVTMHDVG
jgi:transcription elongation factor GreA